MEPRVCLSDLTAGASASTSTWAAQCDKWVLNPYAAIPLFLFVMYGLFVFAMGLGGIFQDCFEQIARASVVSLFRGFPLPPWLHHLVDELSRGIALTASFIPVLMGLFFGLGVLEQSGYMARVSRIAEGLTRWVGLPGKAFVPLLVGFGCNVPAVMGTRILHNPRDRILTIMMLPFMSCGARLAIYALFVSAFFAESGYRYIFLLYLIGIVVAAFTALIFKHAWFRHIAVGLMTDNIPMALPRYRWPDWRGIFRQSVYRVKKFIQKAGIIIIPCSLVLGSMGELKQLTGFDIEWVGRQLTPAFKSLGIEEDNWPATVGLLAGLLAKEVLVGSLGALYNVSSPVQEIPERVAESDTWMVAVKRAIVSVGENSKKFGKKLFHPFELETTTEKMQAETQRLMVVRFGSPVAAFAYLLFVLLYFPCISVVAVIAKELNRYWAALSVLWSTGLAYVVATVFYQSAQLIQSCNREGLQTIGISLGVLLVLIGGVYALGWFLGGRSLSLHNQRSIPVKLIS